MYDKVRKHWDEHMAELELRAAGSQCDADERERAAGRDSPTWRETDMAVVVSQAQNEIDDLAEKGLDIRPHRKRMVEGGPGDEVQGPRRPVPDRLRLRDVDDRL